MNNALGIVAFAVLAGFLGVLIWHVPSPDLVAITLFVLVLAGIDFVRSFLGRD